MVLLTVPQPQLSSFWGIPYLAIYNNEHLPNTIKMAKKVQKFAKYERNTPKIANVRQSSEV